MDSADLDEQETENIHASVVSMLRYLDSLERWMRSRGFPEEDPLRHYVTQAKDQLRALWTITYYLSIGDGPRMKLRREESTSHTSSRIENRKSVRDIAVSIAKASVDE